MRLMHYSGRRIKASDLYPEEQPTDGKFKSHGIGKPYGFWITVEGGNPDWKEWCEAEGFCLENLTHQYEVILRENANILLIQTPEQLDKFTEEYSDPFMEISLYKIKWHEVAKKYQGVVITPYIWQRRLEPHTSWYYSWDCASGCIWDTSCIKEIIWWREPWLGRKISISFGNHLSRLKRRLRILRGTVRSRSQREVALSTFLVMPLWQRLLKRFVRR